MEKQTAVEFLVEQFAKYYAIHQLEDEIKQAKQKDAVIIVDAYDAGFVAGQNFEASKKFDFADGIEYYLENFNSEHLENK